MLCELYKTKVNVKNQRHQMYQEEEQHCGITTVNDKMSKSSTAGRPVLRR